MLGSAVLGLAQGAYGAYKLAELGQTPEENYSISPELTRSYNRARVRSGYGFSPEQRSAYMNGSAGRYAQAYNNALRLSGGNMSQALSRALQASQLRDFSNYASQDAAMQQNNIRYEDQIGDRVSQQRNFMTGHNIATRRRKEEAYGGALKAGLNNVAGAANFFSMAGLPAGVNGAMSTPGGNTVMGGGQSSFGYGPGSPFYTQPAPPVSAPLNTMGYPAANFAGTPYNGTQFSGGISPYGSINPW